MTEFSAHVDLIKDGKTIHTFNVIYRNRLVKGDFIALDNLIFGEESYRRVQCKWGDEKMIKKWTDNEIINKLIKEHVIKDKHIGEDKYIFEVKGVYVHSVIRASCVDFTIKIEAI